MPGSLDGVSEACGYVAKAASAAVLTGRGKMLGIFVTTATATPTLKVYDGIDNSGTVILDIFTPSPGFYPMPAQVSVGCYVEIGGTVKYTAFGSPD